MRDAEEKNESERDERGDITRTTASRSEAPLKEVDYSTIPLALPSMVILPVKASKQSLISIVNRENL